VIDDDQFGVVADDLVDPRSSVLPPFAEPPALSILSQGMIVFAENLPDAGSVSAFPWVRRLRHRTARSWTNGDFRHSGGVALPVNWAATAHLAGGG
jgi:hypothetical protein